MGAPTLDNPETKLLSAEHNLVVSYPYGPSSSLGAHIRPDKVIMKGNVELYEITSKQTGSKIEYTTTPVNWKKLAIANNEFAEDDEIESLRGRLSKLKEDHDSNPLAKSYAQVKSTAKSCTNDQVGIALIGETMSKLDEIETRLSSCIESEMAADKIMGALVALNKDFDQEFPIPDISEEYLQETVANIRSVFNQTLDKMDATIEGAYQFTDVDVGNYLLYGEYSDSFTSGFWLKPIFIEKDLRYDLNNKSFMELPLEEYLTYQLSAACKSCSKEEFEKSMVADLEIQLMEIRNK